MTGFDTEDELESLLSEPSAEDVAFAGEVDGDVLILGAGGKMGPTLARRIAASLQRAGSSARVIAASRFSDRAVAERLEASGVTVLSTDLLDEDQAATLPDCPNVLYLVGMKFGSTGQEPLTWAMNTYLAGRMADRFSGSRIVALSTGNVYPLVPVAGGGSREDDPPAPVGEYAQSCLGRERLFQHFSLTRGTPTCLIRLNYAVEPRYGVLLDIAGKVHRGEPVPLEMGWVNVIWQGDANSVCFRAFGLCRSPASILNLTGPEILPVREIAGYFGERFGRTARFTGTEGERALLSNAAVCRERFGPPRVPAAEAMARVADWVERGGRTLGKPTKFEIPDGRF